MNKAEEGRGEEERRGGGGTRRKKLRRDKGGEGEEVIEYTAGQHDSIQLDT